MTLSGKIFTPAQVLVGSVVGSPLVGVALLYWNHRKAGERRVGRKIFYSMLVYFLLATILPEFVNFHYVAPAFGIGIGIGLFQMTGQFMIHAGVDEGNRRAFCSWWLAVLISLLGFVLSIAFGTLIMVTLRAVRL